MMATTQRLLAIGDIHGYLNKLNELLAIVKPTREDQVVFLGDYIDRGPDSRGVISQLIEFGQEFPQTVFIRGNHEGLLLDLIYKDANDDCYELFLSNGGDTTLKNYGGALHMIPQEHLDFVKSTRMFFQQRAWGIDVETGESKETDFLFVHAGVKPKVPLDQQAPYDLLEIRQPFLKAPRPMGDTIIVHGHTPTENVPSKAPYRIAVDSGVYIKSVYHRTSQSKLGKLTCCNVLTREIWQV